MKRWIFLIVIVAVGGFLYYKFMYKKEATPAAEKTGPVAIATGGDAFTNSE